MVVELFTAPVAAATVLGSLLHIGIADVAVQVHWGAIIIPDGSEELFMLLDLTLFENENVCRDGRCRVIGQVRSETGRDGEDKAV